MFSHPDRKTVSSDIGTKCLIFQFLPIVSHRVTSKSLVLSSLYLHSSIFTPGSPWASSSQDSLDSPFMRDVSPITSPPGPFCGHGAVCACLLCSRKLHLDPALMMHLTSIDYLLALTCLEMVSRAICSRDWSEVDGHVVPAALLLFSYASSYVLGAAPKNLIYIPSLQLKHKYSKWICTKHIL